MSALEEAFLFQLRVAKIPLPVRELKFALPRQWRFDFAYPDRMLAIEIEGGTRGNGRHNRHAGFVTDCDKYNAAQEMGWRVFRFTSEHVTKGQALEFVERVLATGRV